MNEIRGRLPFRGKDIDWSKAEDDKFKQDFGEYVRLEKEKDKVEKRKAELDADHKKNLGKKPENLAAEQAKLAAKKEEIKASTNRRATFVKQLEDTDKVGAIEVRLLTARSDVLLARIKVSNSE